MRVVIFLVGVLFGILLRQSFIRQKRVVGNLKVVMDPDGGKPYMFLEIKDNLNHFIEEDEVLLKVLSESSQK